VTNFEVTGVTGLKNEQIGIKPIVGTQLSYGGKDFNDMDELLEFLKNDSTIEILGFSRDLCENHKIVKMFDHSDTKITSHMLENLKMNPEEGVCLENTLCLKPEIVENNRIDLTIFLVKAALKLDPSSHEEFVLLPRERYTLANVPVPNRFFALLPGLVLEGKNEPTFGRTSVQSNDTSIQTQRSIILILRPFIFKE
jgi:hypothetical protein